MKPRAWLLVWEDDDGTETPEAVVLAVDAKAAEITVYKHHEQSESMYRGTVRHWKWKELPVLDGTETAITTVE